MLLNVWLMLPAPPTILPPVGNNSPAAALYEVIIARAMMVDLDEPGAKTGKVL